jgi:hypothetical protein
VDAVREMTDARGDRSDATGMTAAPTPDGEVRRLSGCIGASADTGNEGDGERCDTMMDAIIFSLDLGLLESEAVGNGDVVEEEADTGDGVRNCSAADGVGVLILPRDDGVGNDLGL